tara:strand:+ start:96 stop:1166 length:1071 start_codon:yes stop_codon:yes gene_type:complete
MNQKIYILLPSPKPTGPIKGAYALANKLSDRFNVNIFFLKKGQVVNSPLSSKIKISYLDKNIFGLLGKAIYFRSYLSSRKEKIITISFCFSADLVNAFASKFCFSIISIRGNLVKNYFYDYGIFGISLALLHYLLIMFVDQVIAMTEEMRNQIRYFSRKDPIIIPNFVDEKFLEKYRLVTIKKEIFNICFVGELSKRKQPLLLIKTFLKMNLRNASLHIVGDGPLFKKIKKFKEKYDKKNKIILYGQLQNPYEIIAFSDLFILPSLAEGIARASLESLFLGTPCILRAVDGNEKLFNENKKTGTTFKEDFELESKISKIMSSNHVKKSISSLLPSEYSQSKCSNKIIELIDSHNSK